MDYFTARICPGVSKPGPHCDEVGNVMLTPRSAWGQQADRLERAGHTLPTVAPSVFPKAGRPPSLQPF